MQYVLAILRYRKPLGEVQQATEEHRAYLRDLKQRGILLFSGPFDPRTGGALCLRFPDAVTDAEIDGVRDGDPYFVRGLAQYELIRWNVGIGREDVERL